MILNGLGFSNRPLFLTPQFFENKPLKVLFREGVEASHFNHYKLGRSLEDAVHYGSELLFSEIALSASLSVVRVVIEQALRWNEWRTINEDYQYQALELGHYGIDQRWLIIRSKGGF